jgi:hypothetical protein
VINCGVGEQPNKYTRENIDYYAEFVTELPLFDRNRLKYCDEASYESLSLRKQFGRAPAGKRVIKVDTIWEVTTYNITIVCALHYVTRCLLYTHTHTMYLEFTYLLCVAYSARH